MVTRPAYHQVAEEFPAGRGFEHADAELFGDTVGGGASRHRTGDTGKALGIAGRQAGIGGEHGEAVGRGDEDALADDQVAVAVAVGCRAKIRRVVAHHFLVERTGVDEVGVGMVAAEIRQRNEVQHRALGSAEAVFEDFLCIGAGDRAHRIEDDAEAAADQIADGGEIEQLSISSA